MTKILTLCVLLFCCELCAGQKGSTGGESYLQMIVRKMDKRGYKVVSLSRLLAEFPTPDEPINFDAPLEQLLPKLVAGTKINCSVVGQTILFNLADTTKGSSIFKDLLGKVTGKNNEPLVGVTLTILGSNGYAYTNASGSFRLAVRSFVTRVIVSHVGYATDTLNLSNKIEQSIEMTPAPQGLDQAVVVAYGQTSPRTNTGSVYVVSGVDAGREPSGNLLDGLEARVPGLSISQVNGVAGSERKVLLGGQHSIQQLNQPLYVIDGVPLGASGIWNSIGTGSAQGPGGVNPLNFLSPENIASITVLKDAAATAIYGNRASNGVILITTRTGEAGPLRLSANVNDGFGKVVKTSPLLSTAQFLQLREEAVRNDGLTVDSSHVPEAFGVNGWNSTGQTNFQHTTIGGQAFVWNAGLQASGGSTGNTFFLSGQLHRESTVFPGASFDQRVSVYSHLRSQTPDGKWQLHFSGMYSSETDHLPVADYTAYELLAPNAPAFTKVAGQYPWGTPPLSFVNILALANNDYTGSISTLFGHLQVQFRPNKHFSLEESVGFDGVLTNEQAYQRIAGQDPAFGPTGQLTVNNNKYSQLLTETIGRWKGKLGPGWFEGLLGGSWQQRTTDYSSLQTSGYPNDLSLNAGIGATQFLQADSSAPYRYAELFGRIHYDVARKYLLDASFRRVNSSRLGPKTPIGNFWAVGGAWVFSEEPFLADNRVLSFGKLRGSFGTTGNEPLYENQFAEVYGATAPSRGYQRQQGVQPVTVANPYLNWEQNYREEVALELGFLNNRLLFSAAAARSWTTNQLIISTAGPVAGLPGFLGNQPGIDVENKALEFELQADRIAVGPLRWSSSFNLTVPRNVLVRWPGLARSNYASTYVEGHSLSVSPGFHWTGVDAKSGLYTFQTNNANGIPGPGDLRPDAGFDPQYYAGWDQKFRLGNWELDLLFDWRRQRGVNPLVILARQNPPGAQGGQQLSNGPVEWLNHWRSSNDVSKQQLLTSGGSPVALAHLKAWLQSDAYSIDASYIRLRSAGFSWYFPEKLKTRLRIQGGRVYIRGQNLWTYTRFPVTDPETQDPTVLPPLRMVVAGLHLSF
ncbi:SusC/RagA family TonB-linked outer membrane protein [Puia dinghuensis]|uniref:SusC/RagA family TonB-linked outer membrane protein n=1 Tax=Puia dinghuensis TaxID=1792502 RepID=A0A8J2UJ59_9BACT|nr:SusC/RagA family TonB-linked outer membrane protein [Puia dinghuensis]GGB23652.1 SusC/RagA family TonB-linked outer membrane protein [Puia dinghuensis]